MANIEELAESAYQKLGTENSTGARDDYRTLALLATPDKEILFNLLVAEDVEALIFRKRMRIAHPDSLVVATAEADYFARIGNYPQAAHHYSTILETLNGSGPEAMDIRLKRLGALCHGGKSVRDYHEQILDDFWALWNAADTLIPDQKYHRPLVRILIKELQSLEDLPIFESLQLDGRLPFSLRNLFSVKSSELRELSEVIEELTPKSS